MIITDFIANTLHLNLKRRQPKQRFTLASNDELLLMPVGDIHTGSAGWPEGHFRRHIEWGLERGAYFIGMGDYVNFTSSSQRKVLANLRPSDRSDAESIAYSQLETIKRCLEPSIGRWIGLLEGNHFVEFPDGCTTDQKLSEYLKAPFLSTSTLLELVLQDGHKHHVGVTIFAHHGDFSFARTTGGQLSRLEDLEHVVEADIYLGAHCHSKPVNVTDRLYRTPGGYLYHRTKVFMRTGGFLRGYEGRRPSRDPASLVRGSYVEQKAYRPTALGGPLITLGIKRVHCGRDGKDFSIPSIHVSI